MSQQTRRGPWKVPKASPVPSAPRVQDGRRCAVRQLEQWERLDGWRCRVCSRPLRPSAPGHRTHSRENRCSGYRAMVLQGKELEKFWWRGSRNSVQGLWAVFRAWKPSQPDRTQSGAPSRVPNHHLQLLLSPTVPPSSLMLWGLHHPYLPPFHEPLPLLSAPQFRGRWPGEDRPPGLEAEFTKSARVKGEGKGGADRLS
ncbi:hypothetical protein P7K49_007003 [Saguinus oedipus]|uniref:Uncharacterized protein n=1 Tax=Saguinus oedipus TaxID=9490 RepID=A0ABQ9W7N5_SAGOE|nr:hypothetical protein P7K49_007003 [Saguinus oedipus]